MSETIQEEKKRKKKPDYAEIIEWAKGEFNLLEKKKSEIINELADKLGKISTIPKHTISTIITQELKGFVSAKWIQETLPPEYKNEDQSNRGKGNKSGEELRPNLPETTTEEDTESTTLPETEELTEDERKQKDFGKIDPKDYLIEDWDKMYTDDVYSSLYCMLFFSRDNYYCKYTVRPFVWKLRIDR